MNYLVRYGAIPEVARCQADGDWRFARGEHVVVQTHRGLEFGQVLERTQSTNGDDADAERVQQVLRAAADDDRATFDLQRAECTERFSDWSDRIREWNLELELLDLEQLLDGKLVLYVLADRGPDCTKLALQAAAAGLGIVEVQPVGADGLIELAASGGCGSGGCGCSS